MDGPADATGVVGECTGAGALGLPGSPALAVLVMYCRMVIVGGDSGKVVHFGISACDASHPRRSSRNLNCKLQLDRSLVRRQCGFQAPTR